MKNLKVANNHPSEMNGQNGIPKISLKSISYTFSQSALNIPSL